MRTRVILGFISLVAFPVSSTIGGENEPATKAMTAREKVVMRLLEGSLTWESKDRQKALEALRNTITAEDVGILAKAAQDRRLGIRVNTLLALQYLRGYKLSDIPRVPAIYIKALADKEPMVRSMAAQTAWIIAADSPQLFQALIGALKDPDKAGNNYPMVSGRAANSLGNLGKAARPAIPSLMNATRDSKAELRGAAFVALGRIAREDIPSRKPIFEHFMAVLRAGKSNGDCAGVLAVLGNLGPKAAPLLPQLRQIARDLRAKKPEGADKLLAAIIEVYIHIGKPARVAVPDLIPLLRDQSTDAKVFLNVIQFIVTLGNDGTEYHHFLLEIQEDLGMPRPRRRAARGALLQIKIHKKP